ncbi:MAG: ArnT family glycosyltransferase [Clostridia bacterium]
MKKIEISIEEFIEKNSKKIILCILAIAFITRVIGLEQIPNAKHVDEAGIMYDAYCFANYGVDRYLYANPVYLTNFGGGQSVLYTILASVFVKIFGYQLFWVRIIAVLFSILYLWIAYLITSRWKNKTVAILLSVLIAIVPFTFTQSRYALDCNLLATFMLLGTYLLLEANKKWEYLVAGILFGISIYTYILSLLVLPIYMIGISTYLLYIRKAKISDIICLAIPIILLAIPILLFLLYNAGIIETSHFLMFSFPKLFGFRAHEIAIKNIGPNIVAILKSIFAIKTQYFIGDDGNQIFGNYYYITGIFFVIGLVVSIKESFQHIREKKLDVHMVFFINLLSIIGLLLVESIVTYKMNSIVISILYFSAIGIWFVMKKAKSLVVPIIMVYMILFVAFQSFYFFFYKADKNIMYNSTISTVVQYADEHFENNAIWGAFISFEPYIYQMVEHPISPYDFYATCQIDTGKIAQYGKYSFIYFDFDNIQEDKVYIFDRAHLAEGNYYQIAKQMLEDKGFSMELYTLNTVEYEIYYKTRRELVEK